MSAAYKTLREPLRIDGHATDIRKVIARKHQDAVSASCW